MHIVHERFIDASADTVGHLLDAAGSDRDRLWPSPAWLPMRFDRSLEVGADGGHGPIRYRVSEYEPGRRVRFAFYPDGGLEGYHELLVQPRGPGRCTLRHVLVGRPRGWMRLLAPIVIRSLHDATVEDILDNAERAATGKVANPATWSRWVRLLRRLTEFPKPEAVPTPDGAGLVRAAFDIVDFTDAWQVQLVPGLPTDPQLWADAVFRDPPRWVAASLGLRNLLVRFIGMEPSGHSAFDTTARTDDEVLLGADDHHLDFRASVLIGATNVTLTTVARVHNRRGRLYMAIVKHVHPVIVRSMLHRALRRLAEREGPDAELVEHTARSLNQVMAEMCSPVSVRTSSS
jgi:hypothetical protein